MSCWLSRFYEELKKHYSLHPNSPISWQISHKNYWDSPFFHEKFLTKCWSCSKIPRICSPYGSTLCRVSKSSARWWWPEMTKQTSNQHWKRKQGLQESLFRWLIISKIKNCLKIFFKDSENFCRKNGQSIREDFIGMFIG